MLLTVVKSNYECTSFTAFLVKTPRETTERSNLYNLILAHRYKKCYKQESLEKMFDVSYLHCFEKNYD